MAESTPVTEESTMNKVLLIRKFQSYKLQKFKNSNDSSTYGEANYKGQILHLVKKNSLESDVLLNQILMEIN